MTLAPLLPLSLPPFSNNYCFSTRPENALCALLMYTKYDTEGEGWKWAAGKGGRVAEVLKVPRLEASTPTFEVAKNK